MTVLLVAIAVTVGLAGWALLVGPELADAIHVFLIPGGLSEGSGRDEPREPGTGALRLARPGLLSLSSTERFECSTVGASPRRRPARGEAMHPTKGTEI